MVKSDTPLRIEKINDGYEKLHQIMDVLVNNEGLTFGELFCIMEMNRMDIMYMFGKYAASQVLEESQEKLVEDNAMSREVYR